MRMRVLSILVLAWVGCVPMGGGGGDGGPPGSGGSDGGQLPDGGSSFPRYLPLAVGASWTYKATDPVTGVETKVNAVEAYEDVGGAKAGTKAFRVKTTKASGNTVSWQEDLGYAVVRHREQSFTAAGALKTDEVYKPNKLRVDNQPVHATAGAAWKDTYVESITDGPTGVTAPDATKTDDWFVVGVDESVTVPAGTFKCLHLKRINYVTTSTKEYWFAAGVGKVKETGGQTEELTAYTLP